VVAPALAEEWAIGGRVPGPERRLGEALLARVAEELLDAFSGGADGLVPGLHAEGDLVIMDHELLRLLIVPAAIQPQEVHRALFANDIAQLSGLQRLQGRLERGAELDVEGV